MKTSAIILNIVVFTVCLLVVSYFYKSELNKREVVETHAISVDKIPTISLGNCFSKKDDQIYCAGLEESLPNVDLNSFKIIGYGISKDKNHVYRFNKMSTPSDPASFGRLDTVQGLALPILFRDSVHTYYFSDSDELKILPFDIESAEPIGQSTYIKVGKDIYFSSYGDINKVENVDANSFRILGGCIQVEKSGAQYAADKNHVYVGTQLIEGINPEKFTQIATISSEEGDIPYAFFLWKDDKNIYVHCGVVIKEADYDSFQYVDKQAQDKNNLYYFNTGGSYTVVPKNK